VLVIILFALYFIYKDKKPHSLDISLAMQSEAIDSISNKRISVQTQYQIELVSEQKPQVIASYTGSDVDGAINLDSNGNVIIDTDLKNLFDYFMIATGELSLTQIRHRLLDFANENLNTNQLQQLMKIYDKYADYLASQKSLDERLNKDLSQLQQLAILSQYRNDFLGEEMARAFFAEDEDYAQFLLENKQVDEANSERQGKWLEAENRATAYQDTLIENRRYQQSSNLTADEIYTNRVQSYGQEAAQRLTELDTQRQQWQEMVSRYFDMRQLIENQQTTVNLNQYESQYSESEIKRLRALWRVKHN
jgi:lipase chaperone LimK